MCVSVGKEESGGKKVFLKADRKTSGTQPFVMSQHTEPPVYGLQLGF